MTTLLVENISVQLDGRSIIHNMSFKITPGEFVGILGPNGAGKSTLFRALLRLIQPYEGKIEFSSRKPIIGYVPQSRQIDADLPMKAWDFVSLGLPHPFRPWLTRKDK